MMKGLSAVTPGTLYFLTMKKEVRRERNRADEARREREKARARVH